MAKITSKGQITIPRGVRARLAVVPGDRLAFEFDDDGLLRVVPVREPAAGVARLSGQGRGGPEMDVEQIDEAIRQRMHRKFGPPS